MWWRCMTGDSTVVVVDGDEMTGGWVGEWVDCRSAHTPGLPLHPGNLRGTGTKALHVTILSNYCHPNLTSWVL